MTTPLPIDPALPEALRLLKSHGCLVVQAEPGAGKTTRLPWALLSAGLAGQGDVLVLQPRRLAARLAARRVADEHGERLGETVGYQVRFEDVSGPKTRLRFLTEGILTRRLLADPVLSGVGAVVLDEFHERHLQGDLGLSLLRALQRGPRPDLRLVVMSATLAAAPVARYLGDAPVLEVPGRRFEVSVEHQSLPDGRPLETQVASALRKLIDDGLDGDVLVFLPGAAEIRKAREACEPLSRRADLLVVPLHGDLPPEEQDRAVRPAERRKVVLSTNVAETSVTLPGVVAVVDSGLARLAGHSAWSGMPTLKISRVAKASAIQRTGRAGRLRAGRCLRLYTRHDFDTRPEHEAPEIQRLDLAETALALHGAGIKNLAAFDWFEPPAPASLDAAERLLQRLGAIDLDGQLTAGGRRMLRFPLHPRQARVLLEAESRGRRADGCLLAALLGEREIRREVRSWDRGGGVNAGKTKVSGPSDVLESLGAFREAERRGFDAGALRSESLDAGAVHAVDRVRRNLSRLLTGPEPRATPDTDPDRPLLMALLAGFPDRVARRRHPDKASVAGKGSAELLLSGGGTAALSEMSVVRDAELLIAVDAEEREGRPGASGRGGALVRIASEIEPEWLLDLFAGELSESQEVVWNAAAERADAVSRLCYGALVLEESRGAGDGEGCGRVLAEAALEKGFLAFTEPGELARFFARLHFVSEQSPEVGLPLLGAEDARSALVSLCAGRRSFAELKEVSLLGALRERLSGSQLATLDRLAPERVRLPGGRQPLVSYEAGKEPWIESRLQDFFGMAEGPRLAGGRAPLVLHLLAPNQRAVQVTKDLAGFWERHYPAIRKELCRRYPRHSWPENPRTAKPPEPRRR
jgi:ATP-dependent helicase HrpB